MLGVFNLNQVSFEFKNRTFYTFDRDYIPHVLGKTGKQTAINTAGSLWKKTIKRNVTHKQAESIKINPKWIEIFNLLQSHLTTKNSLFLPNSQLHICDSLEQISESVNLKDKKLFSEFLQFRELQIHNLRKFKESPSFRKKVLESILDKKIILREIFCLNTSIFFYNMVYRKKIFNF